MTSPPLTARGAPQKPPYTDKGPNCLLVDYVRTVREVAVAEDIPLVDNFAAWAEAGFLGMDLEPLLEDGCHPLASGYQFMARTVYPVLARLLGGDPQPPAPQAAPAS
jgi:lysophospholipase L1-like esterase